MLINQPIRIFATIFLLLTCSLLPAEDRRPNIVFMFTDDQPQNCLSIMGNKHIQTPNLDRLAQRGVLFNNAFVTTAICCCNEMVLSIDLAPTMLALAGIIPPVLMQGKNLMPIVKQESIEWRSHYYYEHTYQTDPSRSPIPKTEGIRTTRWKYIRFPEVNPVYEQLFDLEMDPLEQFNLASVAEHAERRNELREICNADRKSLR